MIFVRLQLAEKDAALAGQMRALFGPQWHSLRLATVGNLVVILFGSDATLMEKALANVKASRAELELEDRFKKFRQRGTPSRTAEFHLSLARLGQLLDGSAELEDSTGSDSLPKKQGVNELNQPRADEKKKAAKAMTSFGMSLDANWVRFDLFVPYGDAKLIVKLAY